MMLKSLKFVALAALLMGTNAQAGPITGSQGFSVTGTTTTSPVLLSLTTATSFFMTGVETTGSQTGNFIGYPNSPVSDTTLNVGTLGTFSFGSTDFGTFLSSLGVELVTGDPERRAFRFLGSFSPGTHPLLTVFDPNPSAGVILNFNQSGGDGKAIAVSWTLEMPVSFVIPPAAAVPEPGSLVLAGMGLFGMIGMTWFRRGRSTPKETSALRG